MAQAYILINVEAGKMRNALKKLRDMEHVQEANMFTGPYDIIAIAEADEMGKITGLLLDEIRVMNGIKATTTCVRIEE